MAKKKARSKVKYKHTAKSNRKYKDSVFIGYLSEKPERLLSLYKAITNDQDAKAEDIKINSIHSIYSIFTHSTYLELIVDVYNINYEHNKELMHKCQELSHYSYLVHRIRHHKANGKSLDDAILIAIKDCIKHNIMPDYLLQHQSEVSEIMKLTWTRKGEIEYECEKAEARGVNLITKMNSWLKKSNRTDDLLRSCDDDVLQQKLLAEYKNFIASSATT